MSCEDYIVGQRPRWEIKIRDGNTLVDPTTLRFEIEKPDGTIVAYLWQTDAELVRDAAGEFHVEYTLDQGGWWKWRQESTGIVTAEQAKFYVGKALI